MSRWRLMNGLMLSRRRMLGGCVLRCVLRRRWWGMLCGRMLLPMVGWRRLWWIRTRRGLRLVMR